MKKSTLISTVLFLLTLVAVFFALKSCIDGSVKQIEIIQVGSSIVLSENAQYDHYVEGLEGKFINGIYTNHEYTYSPNGTAYKILNQKGKQVATAYLAKKELIFKNCVEIDLNTYAEPGYVVDSSIDRVYVTGDSRLSAYGFALMVADRSTPLDIVFHDATIINNGTVAVIYNFSKSALNILCSGDVFLSSGNAPSFLTDEDSFAENLDTALNTWTYGLLMSGINPIGNAIYQSTINNDSSYILKHSDFLISQSHKTVDDFRNMFFGSNGGNGLDSAATIVSDGPVYIHSDGTALIKGGSGGHGGNAGGGGLLNSSNGGNGGDAASAIVAPIIVNDCYKSSTLVIEAGTPGQGGKGEFRGKDGRNGTKADDMEYNFYYWR